MGLQSCVVGKENPADRADHMGLRHMVVPGRDRGKFHFAETAVVFLGPDVGGPDMFSHFAVIFVVHLAGWIHELFVGTGMCLDQMS